MDHRHYAGCAHHHHTKTQITLFIIMKQIIILGAAESGVGAALLAKQRGMDVFVSDAGKISEKYKSELSAAAIPFEEGKHSEEKILTAAEIIKSPGIPEKAAIMQLIREKNISVISEIEFASRYTTNPVIAITGTNGKSTTTSLIHHILVKAGKDAALVGNIGKSFARQIAEHDAEIYVAEISSFQLDDCFEFKPHIAIITNISENHLDRYHYQMTEYAQSKFRIAQKQNASDYFIYCSDSEYLMQNMPGGIQSKHLPFSQLHEVNEGACIINNQLTVHFQNSTFTMSIYELGLQGKHNLYNSMAASVAARVLDIKKELIRESLTDFQSLEHRLEFVANIHGIEFINDSKATNVNSVWYALESITKPIVWIAGGVDKGNDYTLIENMVQSKVKAIVCMGVDNRKIHEAFSKNVDLIINTGSMDEAVKAAYRFSTNGDCVLLSPACASFDLFENFEDRGRQFKKYVRNL